MSTFFDVDWITSSITMFVKLTMKINIYIYNLQYFFKISQLLLGCIQITMNRFIFLRTWIKDKYGAVFRNV